LRGTTNTNTPSPLVESSLTSNRSPCRECVQNGQVEHEKIARARHRREPRHEPSAPAPPDAHDTLPPSNGYPWPRHLIQSRKRSRCPPDASPASLTARGSSAAAVGGRRP